ncbi:MAG TPA: hypothetical protein VGE77_11840 [Nocardioides sp.]
MPTNPPDGPGSQSGHDLQRALFDLFRDAGRDPEPVPDVPERPGDAREADARDELVTNDSSDAENSVVSDQFTDPDPDPEPEPGEPGGPGGTETQDELVTNHSSEAENSVVSDQFTDADPAADADEPGEAEAHEAALSREEASPLATAVRIATGAFPILRPEDHPEDRDEDPGEDLANDVADDTTPSEEPVTEEPGDEEPTAEEPAQPPAPARRPRTLAERLAARAPRTTGGTAGAVPAVPPPPTANPMDASADGPTVESIGEPTGEPEPRPTVQTTAPTTAPTLADRLAWRRAANKSPADSSDDAQALAPDAELCADDTSELTADVATAQFATTQPEPTDEPADDAPADDADDELCADDTSEPTADVAAAQFAVTQPDPADDPADEPVALLGAPDLYATPAPAVSDTDDETPDETPDENPDDATLVQAPNAPIAPNAPNAPNEPTSADRSNALSELLAAARSENAEATGADDATDPDRPESPDAEEGARRPWLVPAIVAAVITLLAAVGGISALRGDDDEPAADPPTSQEPSAEPTANDVDALLASSQGLYDEVATAVTETADLAGLPDAVEVAAAARPESEALVAQAATLSPAPTQPQLDVVSRQRDFIAAVAAFSTLDTATLATFGELATVLRGAADLLAQAEATLELAPTDEAPTTEEGDAPYGLVLTAARPAAVPATSAVQHLTGLVGSAAIRATTEDLTEIAGRLELSTRTAQIGDAAEDAVALAVYARAARAGFDDDSETAVVLDRLLALLDPIGRLTTLDGENLGLWTDVSGDLSSAADLSDDQLGVAAQAAYAHVDTLVAAARTTIAAWEAQVATLEEATEAAAGLSAYAATMDGIFSSYDALMNQAPRLSANDPPSSSVGSTLFRLRSQFVSLAQQTSGTTAPGSMRTVHQAVVALTAAARSAVTTGEAVSREGELCLDGGGTPAQCRLGQQPSWNSYQTSLRTAQDNNSVRSEWSAALTRARAAAPTDTTPPPRPDV